MRVLIVSTHRADKAHYAPLIRLLRADARFDVTVHWSGEYDDGGADLDAAVVLGDRWEMLQEATFLVRRGIPLVHIHGGEHTYGSLDERWRWAITAVADRHCVATEAAYWEIGRLLGDPPDLCGARITGAPGLDDILPRQKPAYPHRLIVHYNPVIDQATSQREFRAILEALGMDSIENRVVTSEQVMWISPNGDRFSEVLGRGQELEANTYRDELAAASVIVGNSSAGIIEAPSVGTWAVNVGDRQRGRVRAGNVIDVPADPVAIRAALVDALQRPRYSGPNPYAHPAGKASEAIRDVLLDMVG